MKKNGFTLIEILLVIVLLAAISVTVGVSMNGIFNKEEDKKYNAYISQIEDAACVYAETHNIKTNTTITINNLIGDGLISKNLKNPKEDVVVENDNTIKGVIIEWKNNEKKCTIKTS